MPASRIPSFRHPRSARTSRGRPPSRTTHLRSTVNGRTRSTRTHPTGPTPRKGSQDCFSQWMQQDCQPSIPARHHQAHQRFHRPRNPLKAFDGRTSRAASRSSRSTCPTTACNARSTPTCRTTKPAWVRPSTRATRGCSLRVHRGATNRTTGDGCTTTTTRCPSKSRTPRVNGLKLQNLASTKIRVPFGAQVHPLLRYHLPFLRRFRR